MLTSKEQAFIKIKDPTIKIYLKTLLLYNSSNKLMGVFFNNTLLFTDHACRSWEKASQKMHALAMASN